MGGQDPQVPTSVMVAPPRRGDNRRSEQGSPVAPGLAGTEPRAGIREAT